MCDRCKDNEISGEVANKLRAQDRFVNEMKEKAANDRSEYRAGLGIAVENGQAQSFAGRGLGQLATPLPQYTPLLVQTMFELYCFPDKRRELLRYQDRPSAVHEIMNLLERAGIVQAGPNNFTVDEDALRVYVDAVCSVPLPTKTWRMDDPQLWNTIYDKTQRGA